LIVVGYDLADRLIGAPRRDLHVMEITFDGSAVRGP
jgi:hypothetical protein